MKDKKILYVEDDLSLIEGLKYTLEKNDFLVDNARTVEEAYRFFQAGRYDLLLLDVTLPDGTGFEVCEGVRKAGSRVPVIFLTAADDEMSIVRGLDGGGDDYVTKPFRPLELIARVKAQLRRYKKYTPILPQNEPAKVLTYKKLVLNMQTYECELGGEAVSLTPTEFSILRILLENQGMVVTLEELFHRVWEDEYYSKNSSTITVHVRHLREKLKDTAEKPKYIKTVWGVGYKI